MARANGCFPTALTLDAKQQLVETAQAKCSVSSVTFTDANELVISCPLRCVSARDGVYECHADGKPSETAVTLVRNDSATCLVQCKPVTGRTHQIRLHLQLIGFPIANDPCYGGQLHFGESQARLDVIELATRAKEQLPPKHDGDYSRPQADGESEDAFMQRTCSWCYIGADEAFNETQLHCSKIWLHALEYEVRSCGPWSWCCCVLRTWKQRTRQQDSRVCVHSGLAGRRTSVHSPRAVVGSAVGILLKRHASAPLSPYLL